MRIAKTIELDEGAELELRGLAKGPLVQARVEQRAQVILLTADGLQNKDIAVGVGLDQHVGWERDLYAPAAPPPQRVVEVTALDRPRNAQTPEPAFDRGQLRHAQPSRSEEVVGQTPALCHPLHAHQRIVAEHG